MTQTRKGNAHASALSPRRVLPVCPLARLPVPYAIGDRIGDGMTVCQEMGARAPGQSLRFELAWLPPIAARLLAAPSEVGNVTGKLDTRHRIEVNVMFALCAVSLLPDYGVLRNDQAKHGADRMPQRRLLLPGAHGAKEPL